MQRAILTAALVAMLVTGAVEARMVTREEALRAAFPGAAIQQSMLFLTEAEIQEASKLSGSKVQSALVARFDATKDGKRAGLAYLDTHIVRTKKESLLLMLDPAGKLIRVEVVAFLEPPEYMPGDKWYRQFDQRTLTEDLQVKRSIHPVTGATLTAQATTEAVRRTLAIDKVLRKRTGSKP